MLPAFSWAHLCARRCFASVSDYKTYAIVTAVRRCASGAFSCAGASRA
ncbi:hypothetical protein [Methylobacterium nodulans]|uniref:Uncharacterized protein n=1 Tax=Methylobacterium nodulans (strain LMG 21967 / CNCM I-2342 / ORS 2060) TaxID=460265 RepID=B8IAD6_METNO|nr:hypothetical protein [Methylobacterium nodulans]ACL59199.1 hypothetical protein Mnod_4323 [Methylobacterium nodulans ORS 2060]